MNELTSGLDYSLLVETKEAFGGIRNSVLNAMQKLHRVKETAIWELVSDSFGDYVESELGISQSFASKLLSVNQHYLLAGVSPEKIEGIDYEKLYLAAKTEGTVEEQIAKAKTLTRRELKEERNEDEGHTHSGEIIQIHKCCGMRV